MKRYEYKGTFNKFKLLKLNFWEWFSGEDGWGELMTEEEDLKLSEGWF